MKYSSINVQSSTIPERNDGQYLDKNASPAEVTDYLRGLQSKLDTILKSSVVLHQVDNCFLFED